MSLPSNREELKLNCLRQLGFPVLEINVDEEQMQDCIDDALSLYYEFHFDAVEQLYMKHQITANNVTNGYIDVPDNIVAVTKIFPIGTLQSGTLASTNPFSLAYQWRVNDVGNLLNFSGPSLTDYYLYKRHAALIDELLVGQVPITFNKHTNRIYPYVNWGVNLRAGDYILIDCKGIIDPNVYSDLWKDDWLRRYTTALIKRMWGTNLKLYSDMKLPGGVSLNGQQIYNEAEQAVRELREELRSMWELPAHMQIG